METKDPVVDKLAATKTARVLTGGAGSGRPLVFLHGYGMSVTGFFRRVRPLTAMAHRVIVPEALSRYYREGASGKVVASWMTRQERLDDIADNNLYLEQVYDHYCRNLNPVFIGFSQGAASMCRWAFSTSSDVPDIVLWGSEFPPDISKESIISAKGRIRVHFLIGDEDEYISVSKIESDSGSLLGLGVETRVYIYKGLHNINKEGLDYISGI